VRAVIAPARSAAGAAAAPPSGPSGERLTHAGAGCWCRHLEATGAVWATPLGLGGAGALIELRARPRPRRLVGLLRTDADCRAALDALQAVPLAAALADPAAALPPALRATPDVWRQQAAPEPAPAARWPSRRPPAPRSAPRSAPAPRRASRRQVEHPGHDGGAAGRELRRRREAAGLGQRELAARVHVSRSYLAEIERGRRDGPDARTVAAAGLRLLAPRERAEEPARCAP
jgi:DNA-binding XRE family transcriptional regulator